MKNFQVYLIFTASGATALIYQVVWSRWLGLVFGNTTTSIAVVLGSFMLGLALGSWAAGRFLSRIGNPLRVYAQMEFGIGLFALSFPYLSRATDFLFTATISPDTPTAVSLLVRALFAFLLLLVPTTLMGTTLPLLTDFFRRSPRYSRGWKAGFLYAANTLGAALGIAAASFVLIESIGVLATTRLAAFLNLVIALIALKFASSAGGTPAEGQAPVQSRTLDAHGRIALAVLLASGAIALASEVLWTRTLESIVGNSTYAFSMIVLLYLVGIALGSWLMSLVVSRLKQSLLWLILLQAGMGIWTVIAPFLLLQIVNLLYAHKAELVSCSVMLLDYLKVLAILLPLSLLSGACFPLATRIIDPASNDAQGSLIAKAYAWNTLGAVAGSLLAGFVIAPRLDYLDSIYALAFLYGATAWLAALVLIGLERSRGRKPAAVTVTAVVSFALSAVALFAIKGLNAYAARFHAKYRSLEVVFHRPGLQGVTTVVKRRSEPLASILLVNGIGMTSKVTDTKMMAHLPMVVHPSPQDTLVICFGMGTTYRSAITHGGNVTVVELVAEVLDAFGYYFQDAERVRTCSRGRMVVSDGRNFLKLTRQQYDVITIDPPPPIDAAGVNHLYSREFLELARSCLRKGGIMAHWIPFPGTRSGIDDEETFNMVLRTFTEVFPHVALQRGYRGVGAHVLGSLEPLDLSMDRIEQRLSKTEVARDVREWDEVPLAYFRSLSRLDRPPPGDYLLITDDRPRLEFYLLRTLLLGKQKVFADNFW